MKMSLERNKYDIREKKLTAESSIGILATLITGFSISLLPNNKIETSDNCNCILWSQDTNHKIQLFLYWLHTILIALTASISSLSVVESTGLYWYGMKLLSKRNNQFQLQIQDFDNYWNSQKNSRQYYRLLFFITISIFLLSFSFIPTVWCNNCILGLITGLLFLISSIINLIISTKYIFNNIREI